MLPSKDRVIEELIMKQLIILCSIIFLLFFFPLQSMKDITTNRKFTKFDLIVADTCQQAKQKGYFTPELVANMKNDILNAYPGLNIGDINVSVTDTPKYRVNAFDAREFIYYDISLPFKDVIAMGDFFGITDAENTLIYHKKGCVPSEVNIP
jgi:hypothetical protein